MHPLHEHHLMLTRRQFFGRSASGIGMAALASLLQSAPAAANPAAREAGLAGLPHFAPRAKRVIFLFMSGGPSQVELLDYKPRLAELDGTEVPDSVRGGQRLTLFTADQGTYPVVAPRVKFRRHGQSGLWLSDLLPHTTTIADEICVIKSMNTEAINHDPATTFVTTGAQQSGRPGLGAWLSYGLGSENADLPSFAVMLSKGNGPGVNNQPLYSRNWASAFLPSQHQGVTFRTNGEGVLYLDDPPGIDRDTRRRMLDGINRLNQTQHENFADPEILARIQQYETAFRMQASVPELMDLADEPAHVMDSYGPDVRKPGSFAANCLLARRLSERGVRFVQLFHQGWDQHHRLPEGIAHQCSDVDQPGAALVHDLKQRGLLDETLVVWGGEFGRTVFSEGEVTADRFGRDHHGRCFSIWMAGGGVKPGFSFGETDDFSYNVVKDPVHVHDFNATLLHLLGIDHERLTYRYQGRDFRLTDVEGHVVHPVIA